MSSMVLYSSFIYLLSQYLDENARKSIHTSLSLRLFVSWQVSRKVIAIALTSSQLRGVQSSSVFLTHVKLSPKFIVPIQLMSSTNLRSSIMPIVFSTSSYPISSSQTQPSSRQILHSYSFDTSTLTTSSFYLYFFSGRPFLPVALGLTKLVLIYEYVPIFGCLFFMWVQRAAYDPQALPQPCEHRKSLTIYQFFLL